MYFYKNEVIDRKLYLQNLRLKYTGSKHFTVEQTPSKSKSSRKLKQVKNAVVRPFLGLGKRLRKFFSGGEEYVL